MNCIPQISLAIKMNQEQQSEIFFPFFNSIVRKTTIREQSEGVAINLLWFVKRKH